MEMWSLQREGEKYREIKGGRGREGERRMVGGGQTVLHVLLSNAVCLCNCQRHVYDGTPDGS